ncbi:hypothetical protein B0H19DRAFT_1069388 [Mycena capillaripes]|nr:hypothetical protein B0H19DRAFT_1069388 [Mycena capillaripes]
MPQTFRCDLCTSPVNQLSRITPDRLGYRDRAEEGLWRCRMGKEHDQISRFLLGIIVNIQLPNHLSSNRLIAAVRGMVDFLHLAHLPKLHNCAHYPMYLKLFDTTDNYNSEYTPHRPREGCIPCHHFKDKFPQITLWLERKEKIFRHKKYIQWRLDGCTAPPTVEPLPPGIIYELSLKMAKHPTLKAVRINTLISDYGASLFRDALAHLLRNIGPQIEAQFLSVALNFNCIPVYHRIKFIAEDPYTARGPEDSVVDSIHVQPRKSTRSGQEVPGRFDTALVNDGSSGLTGVAGYRVVQVRVVFSLKPHHISGLFPPGVSPQNHLAYVEWFPPFMSQPEPHHLMYNFTRQHRPAREPPAQRASITQIWPGCSSHWTPVNVLNEYPAFL